MAIQFSRTQTQEDDTNATIYEESVNGTGYQKGLLMPGEDSSLTGLFVKFIVCVVFGLVLFLWMPSVSEVLDMNRGPLKTMAVGGLIFIVLFAVGALINLFEIVRQLLNI